MLADVTTGGANHLRVRRELAGVTQQHLADLAGCSRSTVRLLEAGYAPPRSPTRERVDRVLGDLEARR
jgi:transcriptional regulator with XRE-family HTH domain